MCAIWSYPYADANSYSNSDTYFYSNADPYSQSNAHTDTNAMHWEMRTDASATWNSALSALTTHSAGVSASSGRC